MKKARHNKRAIPNNLYGDLTNINVELLFRDLFVLRNRFKELGMVIKNGEVHLPDLEERGLTNSPKKRYYQKYVSQNCPSRKIYSNTSPAQKARRDNIT